MKGALRSLAEALHVDDAKLAELEAQAAEGARKGYRVLAVAQAEGQGPLKLIGLAFLSDAPRPDSRRLVEELRALGVSVKMLTGDALPVAQEIGRQVGLAGIVRVPDLRAEPQATDALRMTEDGGGFAEMYPEDKFRVVSGLQDAGHVVAMTGDGVNDAPALRQAEVGIAVEGASDVAKSAASVVLTAPGLGGIVELVKHGRSIYQRILTWIVNKVSRTILKAGFVVVAFLITGRFVISALGMVLLVFMTDFVKIALSTDRVRPSQQPETWNIAPLIRVAVVMGVMMLGEALALLAWGWSRFNLVARDGRLETFTFETLLYFALFSILSIRERRAFWSSRPSGVLAAALALDGLAGVAIGMLGLAELRPLRLGELAAIVGFALLCSLGLNDAVKCAFSAWQRTRGGPHPSRL
jgi:magnesium-transporting ATPase (P-type)